MALDSPRRVTVGFLSCGEDEFCHLRSLYDAFSADSRFHPVVIPYKIRHPQTGFTSDVQRHHDFLRAKGMNIVLEEHIRPHAPWWKKGSRTDVTQPREIDIFFTFLPYAGLLDKSLKKRLRKTRMCYVPYGALVNCVHYRNPFYRRCWKIFLDHPIIQDNFARVKGAKWAYERCVVSGLPKLDAYANESLKTDDYWPRKRSPGIKRVLLLDHWTLEWNDPDERSCGRHGYSQFCKYKDLFLALPDEYPNIDFVFRPHPLLFDNLIRSGRIAPTALEDFVQTFSAYPNAVYDNMSHDYIIPFKESDCLIASGISCWAEYLPSKKPILLLEKSDGDDLNAYGKKLIAYHYRASEDADVRRFLDHTILSGRDDLYAMRMANMQEHLVMPVEGSGVFIKNHIASLLNFQAQCPV